MRKRVGGANDTEGDLYPNPGYRGHSFYQIFLLEAELQCSK